jgi:hypothetical protein
VQNTLRRKGRAGIDIPSAAWILLHPREQLSMDTVAQKFGLGPEPLPHRGITGAERELEILRRLKGLV